MSNEGKHTPGPWEAHKLWDGRYLILSRPGKADQTNVAGTAHEGFGPDGEAAEEANARLIAAAPDLLEALEAIVSDGPKQQPHQFASDIMHRRWVAFENARTAIAKAKGESQ